MKKTLFTLLLIITMTSSGTSQINFCDSIFFEAGKTTILLNSAKLLSKIPEKVKPMELYDITLTAYVDNSYVPKQQQSLAMNRFQEICKYLIKQNMGPHIKEIEIVTVNGTGKPVVSFRRVRGRIDITIQEKFPEPVKEETPGDELSTLTTEPDTVLTSEKGTRIKIRGGSFYPLKISDYYFELKELITTDDFINNNVSTTTSDRQVITTARAIRILAIPKNSSLPIPAKLQNPAIILIPTEDSLTSGKLTLFYQAKDSKSFITWKKTWDSTILKHYEGNTYYMINITQLGWLMVGALSNSCNCKISTPQFQKQQVSIVYPDWGAVVFLDNSRENLFNIPCAEGAGGLITSIKAYDHSGHMFFLEKSFLIPSVKKEKVGIYKIKKRDYVRL